MATVEDAIATACALMNRPDLVPSMRGIARSVLARLHAMGDFHRDITTGAVTSVTSNPQALALPATFRKLHGIAAYGSDGSELSISWQPKGVQPYKDYYGFAQSCSTYMLAGGHCTLSFPSLSAAPASVALVYYARPDLTVNGDGTVESTSWLAANYDLLLSYALIEAFAASVEHKGWLARAVVGKRDELVALYAAEEQTPETLAGQEG